MIKVLSIIQAIFSISAQGINNVFGSPVKPPGPVFNNPVEGLGRIIVTIIQIFILFAAITALIYLLWGAVTWVTSEGEEEKLEKARKKMTNAALGMILLIAVIGIFTVVTGDILGVIRRDNDGNWRFELPTVNSCVVDGQTCIQSSSICCNPAPIQCLSNAPGSSIYICTTPTP